MPTKRILGVIFFISVTSVTYSQMTISNYFLTRCKEFEEYYSVQVSALTYAHWMAIHERLRDDINRQIRTEEEATFRDGKSIEGAFETISHRLFLSSLDSVISNIALNWNSNETRIRTHYNNYLRINNSVIDNSVLKVPFERAIFDTLYQLAVIEKRSSSDAAAIVYTITIREFELQGGNRYYFQPFTRQAYNELREDLLYNLLEIDRKLKTKSVMNIITDFFPNRGRYEPAYSIIESAQRNFRNINNRGDYSISWSNWRWTWELLN
jgi:hypothetical protein